MNGVINVYKPSGISSHDVIYKVRRILGTKKVGHTGTLDPLAEGVLPICVGKATKAVEYIMASEKEYECQMKFGAQTDTQDATGSVTKTSDKRVTRAEFEGVLDKFVGETEQIPPMYSAVHHEGKRLYTLAREGVEVERKARKIQIFGIELLEFDTEKAKIRVRCSKGTYIRTLCEDIGRCTGTLAYMTALKRTKSGVFGIENSIKIEDISEEKLIPIDKMFGNFERIDLAADDERRVLCGLTVRKMVEKDVIYRLYGTQGNFLCLSKGADEDGRRILKMVKSFY